MNLDKFKAKIYDLTSQKGHNMPTIDQCPNGTLRSQCQRCGRQAFLFRNGTINGSAVTTPYNCKEFTFGDGILQGFPRMQAHGR